MKVKSTAEKRSNCPVNAVVEILGDQWSLLILRDMLLQGRGRYSEFHGADEGVATNILSTRLSHLAGYGLIDKHPDPSDGRAAIYTATDRAIDLIPMLVAAIAWSDTHDPAARKYDDLMAAYRADPHATTAQLADRARQFRKELLS
ncbi:MAG: helix-turn-helix domain-containing protein [Pseudomonadota bacterium]